jgi:hypothetical protein
MEIAASMTVTSMDRREKAGKPDVDRRADDSE